MTAQKRLCLLIESGGPDFRQLELLFARLGLLKVLKKAA
jgi:hypothetical protein